MLIKNENPNIWAPAVKRIYMYMYIAPQRDKGYLTTQRDKGYMLSDGQTRKTRRDITDKELHKTIHNHVIIYKTTI